MHKRGWRTLLLFVLALALLAGCGGGEGSGPDSEPGSASLPEEPSVPVIAPVEPEPEPVYPYANPLTGEGLEEDISGQRPIAIMINNLKKSLPQAGVSQADIIYEIPAEGGVTRLLALFQSVEGVGEIGTVRSARDYYVSLASTPAAVPRPTYPSASGESRPWTVSTVPTRGLCTGGTKSAGRTPVWSTPS